MSRATDWTPNSLEAKCLRHLDSHAAWLDILKLERPPTSEPQSWRPFWRIFVMNLIQFIVVLTFLFGSLEVGFSGWAGLREDLPFFIGIVLIIAFGFAAYVTNLYRRSWNRRAAKIIAEG